MPTNPLAIDEFGASLTKKVTVKKSLTAAEPLLDKDTKVVDLDARDPMISVDVEVAGPVPTGIVTGAGLTGDLAVAGVTGGKTIVEKVKYTQKNEGYDETSFSATNAPSGS